MFHNHKGHGLDELDQLNDVLYDLYMSDLKEVRYDIKDANQLSTYLNSPKDYTSRLPIH